MILGALVGFLFPSFAAQLKILGDIFLRLIKTAVAPLVFLCVVIGVVSAGDFKRIGKVGLVAMLYFEIVSAIALAFGLIAGNVLGIGQGMSATTVASGVKPPSVAGAPHSTLEFILNIFPDNFFGAFAKGELLQVLVIALIFGAALLHLKESKRLPIERGLNAISDVFFEFIHLIMWVAPIGTFGAVAFAVGSSGTAVLLSLIYLVLSFYAVVIFFIVAVLGTICALFRINIFRFLAFIKDEIFIVLGTASSESVLPRTPGEIAGLWLLKAERRPRAADRLRLQSRRHVDLHVDGGSVPRPRLQCPARLRTTARHPRYHAADI